MPARPSSSLGFNRNASVSFPTGSSSEQARRRADSSGVVPSGTALAAELYASLFPLDSLDNQDLSIPPPPYELIDPISTATTPRTPNQPNPTPVSHHSHRDSNGSNAQSASASRSALSSSTPPSASAASRSAVSRNTQSAPTSGHKTIPVGQANIGSRTDATAHHHRRAPRGPRPPLNHRSRSEHALKTTAAAAAAALGDHAQYSTPSHRHPQSPTGEGLRQSAKSPLRVPKLDERRPLPAIVDPHKVYQPIVYQPFSPPPTPVSSRPPLSNASRQNRARRQSFGLQRSNHIRASLNGSLAGMPRPPTNNPTADTMMMMKMMMPMGQAGRLRKRASDSFHAEPAWAGLRPFDLLEHPVGLLNPSPPPLIHHQQQRLPSPSFHETTRLVCPECQFAFYDLHFMNLHRSLVHDSESRFNISTLSSSSTTNNNNNNDGNVNRAHVPAFPWPPPSRPPPPLPPSIDRSLLIQAARNIYQANYFT